VADGVLHYLPFGALPIPDVDTYTPLITEFEIVNAPSATAIHVSRQQFENREPAPKTLAVLADPIFNRDDPRLSSVGGEREACRRLVAAQPDTPSTTLESASVVLQAAARNIDQSDIRPLPCTREEAEQILSLISDSSQYTAVYGLEANYDWVTSPESQLDQYQMVLFATHGIFDNTRPEFSGLVLSLVDENGNPQPGYLQLRDIFNLKLNAELVVLSACQTGRGQEIRGEGIIGLTRGFMYAGTKRVMTSLWNVSDPATAELMELFYRGMLEEDLSPTAALRQAQIVMWEKYKDPYLWAAFTIQGEWQN
jgi:CHAT domain-containing protein